MSEGRPRTLAGPALKYLLDTNHWSYLQAKHPAVVARLKALPEEATLYMPVVAQAELLAGVELATGLKRRKELRKLYENAVAQAIEILDVTSAVAEKFATIFSNLRRRGKPIETNDIWIAAIAQAHDLTVVTNDEHFKLVEMLKAEDWTK